MRLDLMMLELNDCSMYPIKSMMKFAVFYDIQIPSSEILLMLETGAPYPLMLKH